MKIIMDVQYISLKSENIFKKKTIAKDMKISLIITLKPKMKSSAYQ
jgi:hypothetical protein